ITQRPVYTDPWQPIREGEHARIAHVHLARSADLFIVAPATANTLARLAHGLADDLLTSTALSCAAPWLIAPAMESHMWASPATQANVAVLRERGVTFVGPASGHLASGAEGVGRMVEPDDVMEAARALLGRDGPLAGRCVVVTAGGTREPIDPVRYIGNRSSGKMGVALARAARDMGADVTLIHGPLQVPLPWGVKAQYTETAQAMYEAVMALLPDTDILIGAAAVADFRPAEPSADKVKKEGVQELVIRLERTPDILAEVGRRRCELGRPQVVVGFAAETRDLIAHAQEKLHDKSLDMVVANDVSAPDAGFAVDTNRVTILRPGQAPEPWPLMSKDEVAERVVGIAAELLREHRGGER
ncbi:MAG: bifunctional phosphopantothenoylcysteine decarboxylase/phosphopantothenate--cysteine ligase CoaBC, partial [Anaerolineae bacterium]|nr:bifunctional phosphopantothenoylcysteine decarboxylase/phosphopantothenate--cysteine ligase CoaBC [Anaerolineae bacterium]